MRKINSSKKGNLPITLFVIGIFAVSGFALLTFFIADFRISNSFVGVEVLQKINSFSDEYKFYKNVGISDDELEKMFNLTEEFGRKYFYEEKFVEGGIPFFRGKKELLFSVKYQVPS